MKIPDPEKLPSGSYRIRIVLGGRRRSITRRTASECKKAALLEKARYENDLVAESEPSDLTLREACDKYISERSEILSPSTIRGYKRIVKNRFQSVMDMKIKDIKNWQLAINLEATKCSAKSVVNAWGFISSVLRNEGSSAEKVRLPRPEVKDLPWLDFDQIQILTDAMVGRQDELACLLALNGLRLSEIYALQEDSIDAEKMIIRVRGARVPDEHDEFVIKKTNKNDTSTRDVPILFSRIAAIVRDGGSCIGGDEKHLCDRINRVCRDNGLPLIGCHGGRRSFASFCAHEGIPEDICMKWGGWSDMTTMRKIYTKYSEADKDGYADRLRRKMDTKLDTNL